MEAAKSLKKIVILVVFSHYYLLVFLISYNMTMNLVCDRCII